MSVEPGPTDSDNDAGDDDDGNSGEEWHRTGPVGFRRGMVPTTTTDERLLSSRGRADWLHSDPWRVLRIQSEFVEGFGALAELGPAVSVFGSARTSTDSEHYRTGVDVGRRLVEAGFAVITGGGPGLMEAANKGACEAGGTSVGLGIELPHEQGMNDWVDLAVNFRYFFARKTMFRTKCWALGYKKWCHSANRLSDLQRCPSRLSLASGCGSERGSCRRAGHVLEPRMTAPDRPKLRKGCGQRLGRAPLAGAPQRGARSTPGLG